MTTYDIDNLVHDVDFLERKWREDFSTMPPLDIMPLKQREQWKEFTLTIYKAGLLKAAENYKNYERY